MDNRKILASLNSHLNFTYQENLKPTSTCLKILTGCVAAIGAGVGTASAYVMYVLGAEFGEQIATSCGCTDSREIAAIGNLFGLSAAIPMAALGSVNLHRNLQHCVNYFTKKTSREKIFKKTTKNEVLAKSIVILLAPFSAIPQATLTWNNTSNQYARGLLTVTATIAPTIFNLRAGLAIIESYWLRSAESIKVKKKFYNYYIFFKNLPSDKYPEVVNKIVQDEKLSCNLLKEILSHQDNAGDSHKNMKIIYVMTSSLVGLSSAIIFYQLAVDGLKDPLKINNTGLANFLAVLSYLLNAALSTVATHNILNTLHNLLVSYRSNVLTRIYTLNKVYICLAIILGTCAAMPLGSLQLENANNGNFFQKLLIGPTFLGPLIVRSKAVYELLVNCTEFIISNCFTKSDLRVSHQAILNTLFEFEHDFNRLDSKVISAIADIEAPPTDQFKEVKETQMNIEIELVSTTDNHIDKFGIFSPPLIKPVSIDAQVNENLSHRFI